jgi:uncharacterized phage protein (TIGR02218 family)
MSYDSRETSVSGGQPFELYQFQTESRSWYYTSGDVPRTYLGQAYNPSSDSIVRTATAQSSETKGTHVKVTVPKDNAIAQLFVSFIPSTSLFLTVFRGHDGEEESEMKVAFTGRVLSGNFTTDDKCELDCAPDSELLQKRIASACFQKQCNRMLFDEGCGVDRTRFSTQGTITYVSVDGLTIKAAEFASKRDGWWSMGYIESGYDKRMVVAHSGDTLTLMNALNGLAVGSIVTVYAGCDGRFSTCQMKFGNGVNFMGWPFIPTRCPFNGSGIF